MNIENLRNIVLFGLILAVVVLGAAFLWRIVSEPKPEEAFGALSFPKIEDTISDEVEVQHIIELRSKPNLPDLVYVYEKKVLIEGEILRDSLDFTGKPREIGKESLWVNGKKSLRLKHPTTRFTYIDSSEVGTGNLSDEGAIAEAKNILQELGLADEGGLVPRSVEKLLIFGGEGRVVTGSGPFNIYSVTFGYRVNNLNLINQSGSLDLINVWIGEDSKLKKIDADRQVLGVGNRSTYKAQPLDEAEKEIEENQGKVVNTTGPIGFNLKAVIQYKGAKVGYLITDQDSDYLQPVYIFSGVSHGRDGAADVTTLISAIKQNTE